MKKHFILFILLVSIWVLCAVMLLQNMFILKMLGNLVVRKTEQVYTIQVPYCPELKKE